MWPSLQETADLVTFTEEIFNGKLHFLFSAYSEWIRGSNTDNAFNRYQFESGYDKRIRLWRKNPLLGTFTDSWPVPSPINFERSWCTFFHHYLDLWISSHFQLFLEAWTKLIQFYNKFYIKPVQQIIPFFWYFEPKSAL